jgi:predicted nucleic acid-binding protein
VSAVAVDTSVLLAIFKGERKGEGWLESLQSSAETATLLVSSVVFAEVRSFFKSDDACRKALHSIDLRHSPFTEEASLLAGKLFRTYRNEGGPRKTILPDFLVAAHAATQADSLATEDRGYLRRYFPALRLLTPDPSK